MQPEVVTEVSRRPSPRSGRHGVGSHQGGEEVLRRAQGVALRVRTRPRHPPRRTAGRRRGRDAAPAVSTVAPAFEVLGGSVRARCRPRGRASIEVQPGEHRARPPWRCRGIRREAREAEAAGDGRAGAGRGGLRPDQQGGPGATSPPTRKRARSRSRATARRRGRCTRSEEGGDLSARPPSPLRLVLHHPLAPQVTNRGADWPIVTSTAGRRLATPRARAHELLVAPVRRRSLPIRANRAPQRGVSGGR